jgi:hypothetical protein
MTKPEIMEALSRWVRQRPGLEYGNYGDPTAYRSEMRSITRQRHDAEALIRFVDRSDSITAADLERELDGRNRLALAADADRLEYCTGQYWPTEYRAAVCRVLSQVVWEWFEGDKRAAALRNFPRPIACRWFDAGRA